jgi:hypothetical protein
MASFAQMWRVGLGTITAGDAERKPLLEQVIRESEKGPDRFQRKCKARQAPPLLKGSTSAEQGLAI